MNGNRNKYASAPMYGMKKHKKAQPAGGGFVITPEKKKTGRAALQIAMSVGLPLLFVVSLFVNSQILRYAFAGAAVLCLALMFATGVFVKNARYTLTLVYGALVVVTAVSIIINLPQPEPTAQTGTDWDSLFSRDDSATIATLGTTQEAEHTAEATVSAAQRSLELFMGYWAETRESDMLTLCMPSWVAVQQNPRTAIFQLRANRVPVSYSINGIDGNDANDTRTAHMHITIDKQNGKAPQTYSFQIILVRVNGAWYIDPNSLNALSEVAATPDPNASPVPVTPTPVVTPSPAPTTVLYYNKSGGKYYHADPNCSQINAKYLPLTATFYYRDRNADTFKNLLPCSGCKAPKR